MIRLVLLGAVTLGGAGLLAWRGDWAPAAVIAAGGLALGLLRLKISRPGDKD